MKILVTGASGVLGSALIDAGLGASVFAPSSAELDLKSANVVCDFVDREKIDAVIHCAAQARLNYCEEHPLDALSVNLIGTANLVSAVLNRETQFQCTIRFLYVSTDGVYEGKTGYYREEGPTIPYSRYGWTKLGGECAVRLLKCHLIVRTRFVDSRHQRFEDAPTDVYSSALPLSEVATAIKQLLYSEYVGTINVGGDRMSEYQRVIKENKKIKPTTRARILTKENSLVCRDSSLDITRWVKLKRKLS